MAINMFAARFRWLTALPLLFVILALAVIAVGTLSGAHSPKAATREKLFDFYQRVIPSSSSTPQPFHIITIDRESLDRIGPWPWPRTILADLVDKASAAGARGVLLVEPVDAPDPLSPETIGDFWLGGTRDEELARQLALLPSTDAALAAALTRTRGAAAIAESASAEALGAQRADMRGVEWLRLKGGDGDYLALPGARPRFEINDVLARSTRLAIAALEPDGDGVLRRVTLLWSRAGRPAPSLALQAALIASDADTATVIADPSAVALTGRLPRMLEISGRTLPLGPDAALRLYPSRQTHAPETPAWRLLEPAASNAQLRGAVVLIGLDVAQGAAVKTPRGTLSRAQAHAMIARQIVSGKGLTRPRWAGYVEAVAVMLLGAAAIMWSQRFDFWKAVGVAALCSLVLLAASVAAFVFADMLLNPLPPALALFLGAFSVAGGRSLGVVLRDDTVRGSFHDSLPEPTMKRLREEGAAEILDGDHRPITVLACELKLADDDMAKLAATPDDATKLIAAACEDLRKTIIETGGAVEQAQGGKLFAYFNAPLQNADHIEAACASALRLIESMDKVNAELEASSRSRDVQVHLAIGIASGNCFVGPMGHGRRNRYSAIGPAVNSAAFLRSQAEVYGPAIICDETVYRKSHHHFAFLELDRLKTNFWEKPMSVYALVGNPFIKSSKSYRTLEENHRKLLAAYRAGDWATARAMHAKVKESPGSNIALFDIYEERIRKMAEEGAPADWDGAHRAHV
ncbi:CHASE2 domain-containing protein [Amphiplicatus metriothermophilus]|uniref:CHASE2 domain-containing protein n=1 Tax=Amphiplicatus metriothermophilus TaxID=1519374 RepID=UPI001178CD1A|nr:adenylate/guanylate cyclase domain-containing protein [Amphiplicatus metriothermophilus]MBB5518382.1 adenylate cyclase [Amphiplicatus metriothermophilus]